MAVSRRTTRRHFLLHPDEAQQMEQIHSVLPRLRRQAARDCGSCSLSHVDARSRGHHGPAGRVSEVLGDLSPQPRRMHEGVSRVARRARASARDAGGAEVRAQHAAGGTARVFSASGRSFWLARRTSTAFEPVSAARGDVCGACATAFMRRQRRYDLLVRSVGQGRRRARTALERCKAKIVRMREVRLSAGASAARAEVAPARPWLVACSEIAKCCRIQAGVDERRVDALHSMATRHAHAVRSVSSVIGVRNYSPRVRNCLPTTSMHARVVRAPAQMLRCARNALAHRALQKPVHADARHIGTRRAEMCRKKTQKRRLS